ncbi:MAG TPA: hydrolase 2, exosortase A system-associated [Noviherbaspirillum sp.]|jgi:exosortase A-associated hydrolase 2|uniref:hydrolase 2, exosortase A system-associated n=1 Tax=Noviherbaspirillum sp. TaxID=1926288 RepID=UPI002DDD1075|nr:hydrolase 2, exosortase A system-associated [Noviherbaspirillum sp.]HEV2608922.1 hydrolase 2, exosortase A system-associated [Noviherbaspirillum sp.]
MIDSSRHVCAEPFFLTAGDGDRFCLFHAPRYTGECQRALVYIHPFAEEMNKSRRMAALQAKRFAQDGIAVLQIDLFGCGDSGGDFVDARWEIWLKDVEHAVDWLANRCSVSPGLWGLRLGGLLALDFAARTERSFRDVLLWQPVLNGETYMTQFLRTRVASAMLAGEQGKTEGTQALRTRMKNGESLEIAGYELAPALLESIDKLNANDLIITRSPVHWMEVVAEAGRQMSPAASRVAGTWTRHGVDLHCNTVTGPAFWMSQEIADCPDLLTVSSNLFREVVA